MKFCKDCKFCEPAHDSSRTTQENLELAVCKHRPKPDSKVKMLVTGASISLEYYYCSTERGGTSSLYCGLEAKNFVPKVDDTLITYTNEILPDANPTT